MRYSLFRAGVLTVALGVAAGCADVVVAGWRPVRVGPRAPAPAPADIVYAHDIHADWIVADVIYAHDVHAEKVQYRQLFENPKDAKGGDGDIHTDGIRAREIHAHDIHARSVVVDTLIAHDVH